MNHSLCLAVVSIAACLPLAALAAPAHTFVIGEKDFLLDGKPMVIRCGELHFARVAPEYWRHRLQMCRAMGLNTVCVYLFWNFHEWEKGAFDWKGDRDVVQFCKMAQEEGLWVLLRPGPYSCAEWEMGGLPWWLVKNDKIGLRSTDPLFLEPAAKYLREVGRVLAPMQITQGGPLLMVQVENEYGSFGGSAEYMGELRKALIDGGFDVPLFACNPPGAIAKGYRPDLFQVVNFGKGASVKAFETLRKFQKTGPLMNGEYYPAWFDMWGVGHRTGDVKPFLADLELMLANAQSFSIYMAHGGTTFGLWSGADRPFRPDTSSYDYDAPISEAGWVTDKFTATRELFARHLQPGETLPSIPAANRVIAIPPIAMNESAPVFDNLPEPVKDDSPRHMEAYEQSRGCMVYRTMLPAGAAGALTIGEVHDFAWIFLDGKQVGVMDRRGKRYRVLLPERAAPARLDILLEAVGRVNFGKEVYDRKGIHGPVQFAAGDSNAIELKGWDIFSLPLDNKDLGALKFKSATANRAPAFWRGSFNLAQTGDTFLDLQHWGKGVAWVNGHCLGRFWNIGPTQTMYCPGPWLKSGTNQIVLLDLLGPQKAETAGLTKPVLDLLRPTLDFARRTRAGGTFDSTGLSPAAQGSFTSDVQWQEARFSETAKGRYLCLEALNANDTKPIAAIAELDALDAKGDPLSKSKWSVLWVDSEDLASSGDAENALDGQPASAWITQSGGAKSQAYPHRLVIDLGDSQSISGIRYLPRAGKIDEAGRIKEFRLYVSDRPFGLAAAR